MRTMYSRLGLVLMLVAVIAAGCREPQQPVTQAAPEHLPATALPPEEVAGPDDSAPGEAPAAAQATVYRTKWGIPHIYSDSLEAAMYAFGYAEAEDRLEDIFQNARTALGRMSEIFGKGHIEDDYIHRLFRNPEVSQRAYTESPDRVRLICDAFAAGINAYVADHPERTPDYAFEFEPWHCIAIGRAMILQWPLGTVYGDLKNRKEDPGRGSNGWAIAPSRTADHCAILLTDPHLTWRGIQVFYEARLKAEEVDINGHFVVGAPMMGLGHTAHLGWACTTGGPDTSDVYELKINPDNPLQYELDGVWKDAETRVIEFDVKDGEPFQRTAVYTEWGPCVEGPDNGVAYAGATPYMDSVGLLEQVYRMSTANSCDEFYEALAMNEFMAQNLLFADTQGNIQYVRTGRTPIRPEGYDWSAPVPGYTSATKWLGITGIADLVQIKNPPSGYMQNCNISPTLMFPDSPMTPDKYPDYIFNVSWDLMNMRGRRALQLLGADDSVTEEDAIAIAMNVYDLLAEPWQKALKAAVAAAGQEYLADADFQAALDSALSWNGYVRPESKGAPIMKAWRLLCENAVDVETIARGEEPSPADQVKLADLFMKTVTDMKAMYGTVDPMWGDIHLLGRGDTFVGCGGVDFGGGPNKSNKTETLRDVGYAESKEMPGKFVARKGSVAMMLMFMRPDGVKSFSVVPWGNSNDPASPHYMDQGRELYSQLKFKETLFKKEELLKNVQSEKVIALP
ncbi:MAG TPA: penicillin acylase family protein [Candidatus Hydrogenedentes bacterium]|mgnify:FL=1|nr:penicillin acylase family protein [Candidatus Hydrogenedentota bacterium]